jgi:hypothetical protein
VALSEVVMLGASLRSVPNGTLAVMLLPLILRTTAGLRELKAKPEMAFSVLLGITSSFLAQAHIKAMVRIAANKGRKLKGVFIVRCVSLLPPQGF